MNGLEDLQAEGNVRACLWRALHSAESPERASYFSQEEDRIQEHSRKPQEVTSMHPSSPGAIEAEGCQRGKLFVYVLEANASGSVVTTGGKVLIEKCRCKRRDGRT
jgi:hypothetical protein